MAAHERLGDDENVTPYPAGYFADPEKVAFPTTRTGVPTFSAAFGRGDEVPPPSQMKFTPPTLGPRFSTPSLEPFDRQQGDEDAEPLPALTFTTTSRTSPIMVDRDIGQGNMFNKAQLSRQSSNASEKSFETYKSSSSATSSDSHKSGKSKRWVIE